MCRLAVRPIVAVVAILTAASFAANPAQAQDAKHPCRRCLNGHRFLTSALVPDPFIATYFGNATGGGIVHNLSLPVNDINGNEVGRLKGDIGFLLLDFRYQYRVTDWLGLRASVNATGRTGTSAQAILAAGASAAFGGDIGASVRALQRKTTYLSVTGDYGSNKDYFIDPFGFARAVKESGLNDSTRAILLNAENLPRWSGGLRGAWAPSDWGGINAFYELGQQRTINSGWQTVSTGGISFEADFTKVTPVPIGLVAAFRGQTGATGLGEVGGNTSAFTFGAHYTGRESFTIGAEVAWAKQKLEAKDVPKVSAGQLRLVTRLDF